MVELAPPDSFAIYGLALRFSFLKHSSPFQTIEARPGFLLTPPSNITYVVRPGAVWLYHYNVYDELEEYEYIEIPWKTGEGVLGKPIPLVPLTESFNVGFYGEEVCVNPLDYVAYRRPTHYYTYMRTPLPVVEDYGNGTALVMHGFNLTRAVVDRELTDRTKGSMVVGVPRRDLNATLPYIGSFREIGRVVVYDSLGPGWANVTGYSFKDGRLCLQGVMDRLLVEFRLGRAYRVDPQYFDVSPVKGWVHRDGNRAIWVLRNSLVNAKPSKEVVDFGNGTRLVAKPANLTIAVKGPANIPFENLYARQHRVEVDTPYAGYFSGAGWFDQGSKARISFDADYVQLDNGTRLVFAGFTGFNGTEIVVDRPLKLKPLWKRMYAVETASRFLDSSTKYFAEGAQVATVMPPAHDFGNGTTIRLKNITATSHDGKVLERWSGRGSPAAVLFTVNGPVKVKVEWQVFHRVKLTTPLAGFEKEVEENSLYPVEVPESVELGNATKLVLDKILVDGEPFGGKGVNITKPTSVTAVYYRAYLKTLFIEGGGGSAHEPDEITLQCREKTTYKPPASYVPEGRCRTLSVKFKGYEVNAGEEFMVNGPSQQLIKTTLKAVKIRIVDIFGMPVPFATVYSPTGTQAATNFFGEAVLTAVPPYPVTISVNALTEARSTEVAPAETEKTTTTTVSPTTMVLVAALGAVSWITVRKLSKRGRQQTAR